MIRNLNHAASHEPPTAADAGEAQRAGQRALLLGILVAVSAAAFWKPLKGLWGLSLQNETYSYIPLIPVMAVGLLFYERKQIFRKLQYCVKGGLPLATLGVVAGFLAAAFREHLGPGTDLFLNVFSVVLLWVAGFVLICGVDAARAAAFELLLLLLMIPLPNVLMEKPIVLVQHGSAEVTALLFRLSTVPVFRNGLTFSLPGLDFRVAIECSGIHSTLALLIGSLLAGHFYLRGFGKRLFLVAVVFPIVCFTNGLRMFGLAVLAVYVDAAFFRGNLHRNGGILFFTLGLVILGLVLKLLRSSPGPRSRLSPVARAAESGS